MNSSIPIYIETIPSSIDMKTPEVCIILAYVDANLANVDTFVLSIDINLRYDDTNLPKNDVILGYVDINPTYVDMNVGHVDINLPYFDINVGKNALEASNFGGVFVGLNVEVIKNAPTSLNHLPDMFII